MTDLPTLHHSSNERRFELLINSVSDYAIYMLDPSGVITTWNPGARRFKGYDAHEIIGEHFSRFFTAEDRAAGVPAAILETAAREGRYESEARRVRKDGVEIWVHVVIDPIRGEDGALLGFAKITRDVSEQRAARLALFESEQRFRLLVQGVHDYAIYMLDLDGTITNWNAGAETIKGYSAAEIVGQHFSIFYTEEDRARGEPARALAAALNEGRFECEAQRVRKDGSLFWASVIIDPIRDETGALVGFAKITRDITEKRRAQAELEEARVSLFQAQKLQALGELTGGIAHDFNNLLTVIRGSVDLLRTVDLPPEKRTRYIDSIADTADRAAALTSRLLAFGRRQALDPEVIDLGVRLDAFGEMLARTLGSTILVRLEVAPDVAPIEADVAELETALLNAVFNARDAMPDGGTLTIVAENDPADSEWVRISIIDTGTGIDAETLERVFEPFFTTKPEGKGTGLGLSQIHGFAAQSGGRAEIASEPGKGTLIGLVLPRTHKPVMTKNAEAPAAVSCEKLRVLLVDDNENVRRFARALLEELRATVTDVCTADEAEALVKDGGFDLVFTDVVMPGRSGLELARGLRETMPGQPVLLATGYSKEVSNGAAAGFNVIKKPYGLKTLTEAIERAMATGS